MGHLLQGTSLALASQVERYGLRTMSGSTGGVKTDAVHVDSIEATIGKEDSLMVGCFCCFSKTQGGGNRGDLDLFRLYREKQDTSIAHSCKAEQDSVNAKETAADCSVCKLTVPRVMCTRVALETAESSHDVIGLKPQLRLRAAGGDLRRWLVPAELHAFSHGVDKFLESSGLSYMYRISYIEVSLR